VLVYSTSPIFAYASGWTDLFTNTGENNGCPITKCYLMTGNCGSTLTVDTLFFIDANTPWGLSAKNNEEAGWAQKNFCYKCEGTN